MNERTLAGQERRPAGAGQQGAVMEPTAWLSLVMLGQPGAGAKKRSDARSQHLRNTVVDPRAQGCGG